MFSGYLDMQDIRSCPLTWATDMLIQCAHALMKETAALLWAVGLDAEDVLVALCNLLVSLGLFPLDQGGKSVHRLVNSPDGGRLVLGHMLISSQNQDNVHCDCQFDVGE